MNKNVYVDYSATTPVKKEVLNEMLPYFSEKFGNASGVYSLGNEAKMAVEESRQKIADAFGAKSSEIFFYGRWYRVR